MTELVHGHVYWPSSINSRACANSVYQALLSPPLEPGNEATTPLALPNATSLAPPQCHSPCSPQCHSPCSPNVTPLALPMPLPLLSPMPLPLPHPQCHSPCHSPLSLLPDLLLYQQKSCCWVMKCVPSVGRRWEVQGGYPVDTSSTCRCLLDYYIDKGFKNGEPANANCKQLLWPHQFMLARLPLCQQPLLLIYGWMRLLSSALMSC